MQFRVSEKKDHFSLFCVRFASPSQFQSMHKFVAPYIAETTNTQLCPESTVFY